MSALRKTICAAAACFALAVPAGCASTSHTVQQPTRSATNPALMASMERQMVRDLHSGGVQLGASDGLGRSLHNRHSVIALARHAGDSDLFAGAGASEAD